MMTTERDYILGTHDEEIQRLGLQHRVWRPRVLDAWRRAGFTVGQTVVDVGCGPGHATQDIAEIVGPSGSVIAVERSQRFLDRVEAARSHLGLQHIQKLELDLDEGEIPALGADAAWCRWVLCFVKKPFEVLRKVAGSLRAGGVFVSHEYFAYSTWRLAPRCPELEEFVAAVMKSWRGDGGEPDIALQLPIWLNELGFDVREIRPIVEVVSPSSYVWQWPKSFVNIGLRRLVDLGHFPAERAAKLTSEFARFESGEHTYMFTPAVLEIIAEKR